MALIVASVPEFTSLTCSITGIASFIISARIYSFFVGAPKLNPLFNAFFTFSVTVG